MNGKKVLVAATSVAMVVAFGLTATQADDRHGFNTEAMKMERGITGQVDPNRLDDKVSESRTTSRSVEERLSEGMDAAAASSSDFVDSSMNVTQASTQGWWDSRRADCEANDGKWDASSLSCAYPQRECRDMGFEWDESSQSCKVDHASVFGAPGGSYVSAWSANSNRNPIYGPGSQGVNWYAYSPTHGQTCYSSGNSVFSQCNGSRDDLKPLVNPPGVSLWTGWSTTLEDGMCPWGGVPVVVSYDQRNDGCFDCENYWHFEGYCGG